MNSSEGNTPRRVEWVCDCGRSGVYEIKDGESDELAVFNASVQHEEMTEHDPCCADLCWQIVE